MNGKIKTGLNLLIGQFKKQINVWKIEEAAYRQNGTVSMYVCVMDNNTHTYIYISLNIHTATQYIVHIFSE